MPKPINPKQHRAGKFVRVQMNYYTHTQVETVQIIEWSASGHHVKVRMHGGGEGWLREIPVLVETKKEAK